MITYKKYLLENYKDDNDAYHAYEKAKEIGHRIPELEPIILKSPAWITAYAKDVIKKRWPEAEKIILHSTYLWCYIYSVIKKRWPEAEPILMKNPGEAVAYATTFMKNQRWPEAEPYIMKDPLAAINYATLIIRDRWPEAESYIMKVPECAMTYIQTSMKNQRWPEAEPYIMQDKYRVLDYTEKILKCRWLEAETTLAQNPKLWKKYVKLSLQNLSNKINKKLIEEYPKEALLLNLTPEEIKYYIKIHGHRQYLLDKMLSGIGEKPDIHNDEEEDDEAVW